jgi:hypothetical protein
MMISIIKRGFLLLLCGSLFLSFVVHAEDSPHWSKTSCQACHVETAPVAGNINLQAADAEALCETCHGDRGDAMSCRHGSGLPAGDMTISETLRSSLKGGQVVCSTCHDAVYQCEHARIEYSFQNPGFLRDRTARRTSKYCLKCHDASAYKRLNPHQGIAGDPPTASCLLCHTDIPESDGSGGISVSFNMQHDLNDTCRGCHDVRPHPKNMFSYDNNNDDAWVHLVIPTTEMANYIRDTEANQGIRLPLHPETGEIFCGTCHDPHTFSGGPVAEQPKHRLRANDICQVCHEK